MVVGSGGAKSCALTKGPKAIKHRADSDSASECPDKCAQLFMSEYEARNAAEPSTSQSHKY
jgi:hypothetical protein